jgi:hypothetical protein
MVKEINPLLKKCKVSCKKKSTYKRTVHFFSSLNECSKPSHFCKIQHHGQFEGDFVYVVVHKQLIST